MKKEKKVYIKNFFHELKLNMKDLKSLKTAYKQIPNILTFSRAIAPIPINILFFTGNIPAAVVVCGLTFLTDAFDGTIARKLNIQSQFGADLDAICDKLLIAGIALPIIITNPFMLINVMLEGLISITNVKAKLQNKNPKSSMIGKFKTWILSLTILSGYITSLLNIHLSLLKSILMIIPAIVAQNITYIFYLKTNNQNNKEVFEQYIGFENNKVDNKSLEPEQEKTYTLEDYKKLKEELLTKEKEQNKIKIKKIN